MSAVKTPRRFAPLGTNVKSSGNLPKLQGVVFDVDGTLCMLISDLAYDLYQ